MKRGVTYILTLLTIGLLYFGSLFVVSRPSAECLGSLVNGKTEFLNREIPLSSPEELVDFNTIDIPTKKEKAVIVVLVRNNELVPMRRTMREFEE
jgi:alpha 1,2-mannosyltransferase